jgi:hypothetical protein
MVRRFMEPLEEDSMLLIVPAILACITALLCGGSLRSLVGLPIRGGLILLSLGIQLAIYVPFLRTSPLVLTHAAIIYIIALLLAVAGMLRNWHLGLPVRIATLGLLLNATVIAANGGHMPVNAAAMRATQGADAVAAARDMSTYRNTRLADRSSLLLPLSDIIPVRVPAYSGNVYSAGDVLISSGIALLVFRSTRRRSAPETPAASRRSELAAS